MAFVLDTVRVSAGGLIAALGLALIFGGAIGVLRFPDFYARLQAGRVADSFGAVIFVLGLAVLAGETGVALRLVVLAALLAAAAPLIAHLAANAAHSGGLAPLVGAYTAPRPGARRDQA